MKSYLYCCFFFFFFQAEDGIRDRDVTGVQTCALPIFHEGQLPLMDEQAGLLLPARHRPGNAVERHDLRAHLAQRQPQRQRGRGQARSEERRVGKECRSRWWPYHEKKQKRQSVEKKKTK